MITFTIQGKKGSLQIKAFQNPQEIGNHLDEEIVEGVLKKKRGEKYLLGLPTGSTPMPIFEHLPEKIKMLRDEEKQHMASCLRILVMDDFVDPLSKKNIDAVNEWSAVGFIVQHLVNPLNKVLSPHAISIESILYPRVNHVTALRDFVIAQGGIDMQVIATDPFEGHVAQNFPMQPFEKKEAEKAGKLSQLFLKYHPWASVYEGVTFDLHDFLAMVRANPNGKLAFVIFGKQKEETLKRFLEAKEYHLQLPITFLWTMPRRCAVYTDALALLEGLP